ncbi:MAG TPA: sigma-70 family RNA polymerase sigma factor, partial [Solirubrobacteraceae bacterium]
MEAALALAPAQARATTLQTDADLVAAVRRGDDRAFEELYARYTRRIASYVFGMVKDHARAEDLTQDVFVSALRRMRDTDRPIAFKPWIYEIAKNACIDQFRRQRRAEEVSFDAEEGLGAADYGRLVTGDPSPDVALDHKQQLDHLRGALGGLSEAHHQILVMREFEGLSYREIGERMSMSRPSVESTLFRARKRLSEEYEELVTGARCVRIQAIIGAAGGGTLGARDRRRMARHLSYCQPCRRHAHAAGLSDVVPARRPLGAKIAALLPLPAFLRRRVAGRADDGGVGATVGHGGTLAQWSSNLWPVMDSTAGGWTKAVATAATIAVAGVGAGAMSGARGDRVQHPSGASGLVSLAGGHHRASAPAGDPPAALSAAPVSRATVAVPPRSAASGPTAAVRSGSGAGSGSDKAGDAGSSPAGEAPAAGDGAAALRNVAPQAGGASDQLEAVTRQLPPGLGGGGGDAKPGDGHQGAGDATDTVPAHAGLP